MFRRRMMVGGKGGTRFNGKHDLKNNLTNSKLKTKSKYH